MARTNCFGYEDDHREAVRATQAAHNKPVVDQIAELVHLYPKLLGDLATLLKEMAPIPVGSSLISEDYYDIFGGVLNSKQEQLRPLLDVLYSSTNDLATLNTYRGVILERIILKSLRSRITNPRTEMVVMNITNISLPGSRFSISGYSIDIAACFYGRRVEFYACKLRAKRILEADLEALQRISKYFAQAGYSVRVALCCLQHKRRILPETLSLINKYNVELFTVETIPDLMRPPA